MELIMLKDIVGVKFIGGNFASLNELRLLDPTDGNKVKLVKGSILYGRNGSGKSTIAKAVKKLIVGGYPHIAQAYATNKDGNIITLTDDEKSRVFVFDEEFVDQNVKLQEDSQYHCYVRTAGRFGKPDYPSTERTGYCESRI